MSLRIWTILIALIAGPLLMTAPAQAFWGDRHGIRSNQELVRNLERLDHFVRENYAPAATTFHPRDKIGQWMFKVHHWVVILRANEIDGRIQVMTPITDIGTENALFLYNLLQANYARTLDSRYAIQHGELWAIYLHPLDSCRFAQLKEAVRQVTDLARNTGGTFSAMPLKLESRK